MDDPGTQTKQPSGIPGQCSISLKKERFLVLLSAFTVSAVLAHFIHTALVLAMYPLGVPAHRAPPPPIPAEVLYAPEAYRVGMPVLNLFLTRLLHPVDPALLPSALDFCSTLGALLLLHAVAVHDRPARAAQLTWRRLSTTLLFLAFVQFPVQWVVPWQRPETMPSTLYLAFALFCLTRAPSAGRSASSAGWTAALLAATLWQGFVRADIAAFFGASLALTGLLAGKDTSLGPRTSVILRGAAVACVAAAVQAWLQLVRFPHLHYRPGTPVFTWRYNLTFHNLQTVGLAVLPFAAVALLVLVRRIRLGPLETAVALASASYLWLWLAVGNLAEVRIFVPYLMALCMVSARVLEEWIAGQTSTTA